MTTADQERQKMLELLPWYLNGTLNDDETEQVRRYLEANEDFAAEVDETDTLLKTLAEERSTPMLTHDRLDRLMARVDEEPRRSMPTWGLFAAIDRWWQSLLSPGYRTAAAVAASVAVVAVLFTTLQPDTSPDFRTLSSDRPAVSVQVQIAEGVTPGEAEDLFDEFSLVAKPEANGQYSVTLPENTTVSELYDVLQSLRDDHRVADARALTGED
ncbi:MAG: hypothetical protein AAF417_14350 [Pseudomonadota bacterium]